MQSGGPARILVIDDDPKTVETVQELLQPEAYEVVVAYNGSEGIEEAKNEKPDLILLDLIMPNLTGFAVCRRLKASSPMRDIPIVFLTAVDFVETRDRAGESGADGYLTKPISRKDLLELVNSLLKRGKE